jgi:hypothetical protein
MIKNQNEITKEISLKEIADSLANSKKIITIMTLILSIVFISFYFYSKQNYYSSSTILKIGNITKLNDFGVNTIMESGDLEAMLKDHFMNESSSNFDSNITSISAGDKRVMLRSRSNISPSESENSLLKMIEFTSKLHENFLNTKKNAIKNSLFIAENTKKNRLSELEKTLEMKKYDVSHAKEVNQIKLNLIKVSLLPDINERINLLIKANDSIKKNTELQNQKVFESSEIRIKNLEILIQDEEKNLTYIRQNPLELQKKLSNEISLESRIHSYKEKIQVIKNYQNIVKFSNINSNKLYSKNLEKILSLKNSKLKYENKILILKANIEHYKKQIANKFYINLNYESEKKQILQDFSLDAKFLNSRLQESNYKNSSMLGNIKTIFKPSLFEMLSTSLFFFTISLMLSTFSIYQVNLVKKQKLN